MAKQKRSPQQVNLLSVILDISDIADVLTEKITGKSIPDWLRELQEQSKIDAERLQTGILQPPTTAADPYAVLGLPPSCSIEDVKERYKQLSNIFHPDKPHGYTEAMKTVNQAYEQIMKEKGTK